MRNVIPSGDRPAGRKNDSAKLKISITILSGISFLFFSSFFFPLGSSWVAGLRDNLANVVGISASISPNKYNTIAQQLTEKEEELVKREEMITQQEMLVERGSDRLYENYNKILVAGAFVSGVLFVLLGFNFYWDWRRNKLKIENVSP